MRVVFDVNVLIAGMMARRGAPARLLLRWLEGEFELFISDKLVLELRRALAHPKVRSRISATDGLAFIELLEAHATRETDPEKPQRRSRDPGDDYLLALAASCSAIVVSGDQDLLALSAELPIYPPSGFLANLV